MDVFESKWDTKKLKKINQCRLYLKVNTVTDIAHIKGKEILSECYQVKKARKSKLQWPNQRRPGKKSIETW